MEQEVFLPNSLSDHPSLVGIVRLPLSSGTTYKLNIPFISKDEDGNYCSGVQIVDMSETITQVEMTDAPFTINKSSITDYYPYTYYVLTDGECEPLVMYPQYMPSTCKLKGKFALSHSPVERYYIEGYKGDFTGNIYNITNTSQMMLPTASNEGINFLTSNANATTQERKTTIFNSVLGSVGALATGNVGLGINNALSGIQNIQNANARMNDITLTPSSINSFGSPSTRKAFNNNKVRVLKFTIENRYKTKIQNFVKRFGYKYNSYDTIDIKSYKGYIKYNMPDVDGKIDNAYIDKIVEILERGIYFD